MTAQFEKWSQDLDIIIFVSNPRPSKIMKSLCNVSEHHSVEATTFAVMHYLGFEDDSTGIDAGNLIFEMLIPSLFEGLYETGAEPT
jgi:hypothetical protein